VVATPSLFSSPFPFSKTLQFFLEKQNIIIITPFFLFLISSLDHRRPIINAIVTDGDSAGDTSFESQAIFFYQSE